MKRFLIIFAICFASLIAVIGGVFGVKYLKGDFNEKIINPEQISFEVKEYNATDDFTITINTTTEGVTVNKIDLSFPKNVTTYSYGKGYITDRNIIVPTTAQLGVPFKVELYKTQDPEADNNNWIKGGVSNLIATSKCITVPSDTATIYVDVPVYKTELVMFTPGEGEVNSTNQISDVLTYIEGQNSLARNASQNITLNAGDTFYLGLKFYPQRSAFKYSKVSSSNLLVEYYDQILAKANSLGLDYSAQLNALKNLLTSSSATTKVDVSQLFDIYSSIINLSADKNDTTALGEFTRYLDDLNKTFTKQLKFYTFMEKANNGAYYTTRLSKIDGTNIYKMQATTESSSFVDSVTASFYSYTFYNSYLESYHLTKLPETKEETEAVWVKLENLYLDQVNSQSANKTVDRQNFAFDIVDVDVDTITLNGKIENFDYNTPHTIYAIKQGTATKNTSYLQMQLTNSNIQDVNLQKNVLNVGIRFEKHVGTNWEDVTNEIAFVDLSNYKKVTAGNKTYYLPMGNSSNYTSAYWQIYFAKDVTSEFRARLAYFTNLQSTSADGEFTAPADSEIYAETAYFRVDQSTAEKLVSWKALDPIKLGVINITNALDMSSSQLNTDGSEKTKPVNYNTEVDLLALVNIPTTNKYRTPKFFLYSDEDVTSLSEYFYNVASEAKTYSFNNLDKKLFELSGDKLKLKKVPSFAVKVIFATIKTNELTEPIFNNGLYEIVEYSCIEDSLTKNLSSLSLIYENSINTLNVSASVNNTEKAGVAQADNMFKMAQGSQNVLKVQITANTDDEFNLITNAIKNNALKIEARLNKSNATNYITYSAQEGTTADGKKCYNFILSTNSVIADTIVRLYAIYEIDGNEYLFAIPVDANLNKYYDLTILKDGVGSVEFNFTAENNEKIDLSQVDYISAVISVEKQGEQSEPTFKQTFTAVYKNGTTKQISVFNNQNINVVVRNFLGNVDDTSTNWSIQSSNAKGAVVEDGKKVTFIGSTTTENVTLYLYLGSSLAQQVNFKVQNAGKVSEVVLKGSTIYQASTSSGDYTFTKKDVSLFKTDFASATSLTYALGNLLKITYAYGENSTAQLPLKAYVADEKTRATLNSICTEEVADLNTEVTSFTLSKQLGSVVSLTFVYVCKELNISQKVTITIEQMLSVGSVEVMQGDESITKTNSVYNAFAGIEYTINLQSECANLYYYIDEDTASIKSITKIGDTFSFNHIFEDNSNTSRKIHITNIANGEVGVGDLNYVIEFNVQNNLKVKALASKYELTGNSITLQFTDLLERIVGSLVANPIASNMTFSASLQDASGNTYIQSSSIDKLALTITLTFKPFTDGVAISFAINANNAPLGGKISMLIVPQDLRDNSVAHFAMYSGEKAIVVSNGEQVANGDNLVFADWFASGADVVMEEKSAFLGTYTTKDNNIYTVAMSTSDLFVATSYYVNVTSGGITSKYRIILSLLKFPFVEFKDQTGNAMAYHDLDIYKLFDETENTKEYYQQAGIAFFEPTTADEQTLLSLVDYQNSQNSVYINADGNVITVNTEDGIALEFLDGDYVATNFATIQTSNAEGVLKINLIPQSIGIEGGVYLKVTLKLSPKGSSKFVNVPIVVYLAETQKLNVVYPNSGAVLDGSNIGNYASDEYDQKMLIDQLPFAETNMEYLSFDEHGTASLILNSNKYSRLQVYNLVGTNWSLNSGYNSGYTMSIEKIVKNISGVWSSVNKNDFATYASIALQNSFYTLNVTKSGADVLRIKIKIATTGGAENFYYVSVGEVTPLNLMCSANSSSGISVGKTEAISLDAGQKLIVGESQDSTGNANDYKYYYYLTNLSYNKQLKYRILDMQGNVLSLNDNIYATCQDNMLTIKVQPLGNTFLIEIYTTYGVLSTITVTVNPAYLFTLKSTTIYSGTSYSVLDLIDIVSNLNKSVTQVACENNEFYSCDGTNILFNHLANNAKITLKLTLTIDGYNVNLQFSNVQINARIVSENYSDASTAYMNSSAEGVQTTFIANNGSINLSKELWSVLFVDKKLATAFDGVEVDAENVTYHIIGFDSAIHNVDITKNTTVVVGATTTTKQIVVSYEIRVGGATIAIAYARVTIEPQYIVTINYPKTISELNEVVDFGCEYVQTGASVDLEGENFNGNKRISVVERETLTPVNFEVFYNSIKVTTVSYTDVLETMFVNGVAQFEYQIKVGDYVYGVYIVNVIKNSPITIEQQTQTIYISYGDDSVFGYVDAEITLPQLTNVTDGQIKLYISSTAGDTASEQYKMLCDGNGVFYKAGEKIRAVIPTAYFFGTSTKVFAMTGNSASVDDVECSATFTPRAKLLYYGNLIDYRYYSNILNDNNITGNIITNNSLIINNLIVTTKTPIVSSESIATNVHIVYTFDIAFNSSLFSGTQTISLNANMQVNGYSFVDLFDVRDNLGNKFWLNHVKNTTNKAKSIDLTISGGAGAINCLPIDAKVLDEVKYDFMLKPVGASNGGTKVNVKFTYTVNTSVFEHTFEVNIVPDVTHVAYNNDGTVTQNSQNNPLKLVYTENGSFVLASETQTNYVYAYSIYDQTKENVIQKWSEPVISGDTGYITITKQNHELLLKYVKMPTFGNKKLVVAFTDPYGYTFNYYIELIANIDVSSVVVDSKQVFEGESLNVYNKNIPNSNSLSGIALTLTTGNAIDTATGIIIESAEFVNRSGKVDDILIVEENGNKLTIKYLPTDTWRGNGLSYTGTLNLIIKSDRAGSEETYVFSVSFTIYKKYEVKQTTENMFVRDGKEIKLGYFVDVYDYSQNAYLAKPVLTQNEEIYLDGGIDLSKVKTNIVNSEKAESDPDRYKSLAEIIEEKLVIINAGDETTPESKEAAWKDLMAYGVTDQDGPNDQNEYTIGGLGIALRIKAIHKTSGASTHRDTYYGIDEYGKVEFRLVLGENAQFDSGVNLLNYNFEVWLLNINDVQEVAQGKLATTVNADCVKNNYNYMVEKLLSGNLYHVSLTISSNFEGEVKLALKLESMETPVIIKEYTEGGAQKTISKGSNNFYLYNTADYTFENVKIALFTGSTGEGESKIDYINGLASDQILDLKNIKSISKTNTQTNTETSMEIYTPKLAGTTFSPDSTYGIQYQSVQETLNFAYIEHDKNNELTENAMEQGQTLTLNVTTQYTGVDTSYAYISSIHYCYVNNLEIVNGEMSGEKTISVKDWSEGFELEAGVGVSAIFAKTEDKTFATNANSLFFEAENVQSKEGETVTNNSLFSIDADKGDITLKQHFRPNDYYIAIKVYCKYNNGKNKLPISTIYVSFVCVTTLTAYTQQDSTGTKYDIDISKFVTNETQESNISLGLFDFTYNSSNKHITITSSMKEAIANPKTRYELVVGDVKSYVYINVLSLVAKEDATPTAYKLGDNSGWVILAEDFAIHGTLDATTMKEYNISLNDHIKLKYGNNLSSAQMYICSDEELRASFSDCGDGKSYYIVVEQVSAEPYFSFENLNAKIALTLVNSHLVGNGTLQYTGSGQITIDISSVEVNNGEVDSQDGSLKGKTFIVYAPKHEVASVIESSTNTTGGVTNLKLNNGLHNWKIIFFSITIDSETTRRYVALLQEQS